GKGARDEARQPRVGRAAARCVYTVWGFREGRTAVGWDYRAARVITGNQQATAIPSSAWSIGDACWQRRTGARFVPGCVRYRRNVPAQSTGSREVQVSPR